MKAIITLLTVIFVFSISFCSFAQFDILKQVEKKIEKKAEDETDTAVDKTVDAVKNGGKKDEKGTTTDNKTGTTADNKTGNSDIAANNNTTPNESQPSKELELYAKYDFVAGDKVIFEDNLAGEESGEFPSRWDLLSGSAENASLGNDKVIHFISNNSIILPLMDKKDFLPEVFTIEFDAYFEKAALNRWDHYQVRLFEGTGGAATIEGKIIYPINIAWDEAKMGEFGGRIASFTKEQENWEGKWKHIAISFNKEIFKIIHG